MISRLSDIAEVFLQIHLSKTLDSSLRFEIESLSLDDAYEIQRRVIAARIAGGESVVGYKVGCTSKAIRRQFGLTEPICGRLMIPHVHHGDTVLNWGDYSMVSFGAIVVERSLERTFYGRLKPISGKWIPEALQVPGFTREETLQFDEPKAVMRQFADWIAEVGGNDHPKPTGPHPGPSWMPISSPDCVGPSRGRSTPRP